MRSRICGLVAVVVVANLGLGAAAVGRSMALHRDGQPPAARGPQFRVLPDDTAPRADVRATAIRQLLANRAAAILRRDRTAFLTGVDPLSAPFRAQQSRYFENLRSVPFASWSYTLDTANTAPVDGVQFLRYLAPVWLPRVVVHYAIRGFDSTPTAADAYYTFVQRGTQWYIGSDADDEKLGYVTSRDVWDFGPVRVVRSGQALVLGHPGGPVSLRALAAEADRDIPRVTRVWGRGWSQRVVVVAPNSTKELSALLADGGDLSQIAAVATAELVETNQRARPTGDRVLINPGNYVKLSARGREVVVTHEITHVATRAASGPTVPDWLVEGFADYIGYRDLQVSPTVAARELRAYLAQGRAVPRLPTDDAFSAANKRLALAYDESWLAAKFIAERWDPATLVRLYRAIGASTSGSSSSAAEAAMAVVLREPVSRFTRQWQSYVVTVLR